jgi:hypothetical protein
LMSCPDWTRPQYGSRGNVVTAPPFARRPFFKGGKLFRHAIALILSRGGAAWKNAKILYNTCSRIFRNLKEFRSGAIRVVVTNRERRNNFRIRLVRDGR